MSFAVFVVATAILGGCYAPSGSGNNPVAGAMLGVTGVVDAKNTRGKQKQQQEQKSLEQYLEKNSK